MKLDPKVLADIKRHATDRMKAAVYPIADLPDSFMDQADVWREVAMAALAHMMAALVSDMESKSGDLPTAAVCGMTAVAMQMLSEGMVKSMAVGHEAVLAHRSAPPEGFRQ